MPKGRKIFSYLFSATPTPSPKQETPFSYGWSSLMAIKLIYQCSFFFFFQWQAT